MDLTKAIRELHAEKVRLEKIISSLEELLAGNAEPAVSTGKRRGRKFMNSQARKEVSERMKKYWAERREHQTSGSDQANTPSKLSTPTQAAEGKTIGASN
jgi:hypothetical protein